VEFEEKSANGSTKLVENPPPLDAVPHSARGFEVDVGGDADYGTDDEDEVVEGHSVYSFRVGPCNFVSTVYVYIRIEGSFLGDTLTQKKIPPHPEG
jgi:hypothetical protein